MLLLVESDSTNIRPMVPVLVYLSGPRRGHTDRLDGATLRIGSAATAEIQPTVGPDPAVAEQHAVLHRAGAIYELGVLPGCRVWVNGKSVTSARLHTGDVLEIGHGGPVLRFRWYPTDVPAYKPMAEAFADGVDGAIHHPVGLLGRGLWVLVYLLKALVTQTSPRLRLWLLALLTLMGLSLALLTYHSVRLESRLGSETARLNGITETLARTLRETPSSDELTAVRTALRDDLVNAARRLDELERQRDAGRRIIAAAAPAVVFLQGSYGLNEPTSRRPLRYVVANNGRRVTTPWDQPLFSLDGAALGIQRYDQSADAATCLGTDNAAVCQLLARRYGTGRRSPAADQQRG